MQDVSFSECKVELKGRGTFEVETGHTSTMGGVISGVGDLGKEGEGTLALTGDTVLKEGVLKVSKDDALGGAASVLNFKGGTLFAQSDFTASARKVVVYSPVAIMENMGSFGLVLSCARRFYQTNRRCSPKKGVVYRRVSRGAE